MSLHIEPDQTSPAERPDGTSSSARHVFGLDSLRFVLAAWVVLGHFGASPLRDILIAAHAPRSLVGFPQILFNGGAAVMVFFIISGFCIHLPFTRSNSAITYKYFVRREIRILPPVLAMCILGWLTNNFLFLGVVWSLVCEEIYYLLYPLFKSRIKAHHSVAFVSICLFLAVSTILLKRNVTAALSDQGVLFSWLMFAPLWVLGALMAEYYSHRERLLAKIPLSGVSGIRLWRFGIIVVSIAMTGLEFVYPSGRMAMLLFLGFGLLAVLWLDQEIHFYRTHAANRWLESLGKASYSLYLSHAFILKYAVESRDRIPAFQNALYRHGLPSLIWFPAMAGVASLTAIMYFFVERPSHQLARRLGSPKIVS